MVFVEEADGSVQFMDDEDEVWQIPVVYQKGKQGDVIFGFLLFLVEEIVKYWKNSIKAREASAC